MQRISYAELNQRLDNVYLFNKAQELDPDFYYEGLENGGKDYCYIHEDCDRSQDDCEFEDYDVYQMYLIGSADADYLKRHTNELIWYSDKLDEYIWGVTHFGTSWSGVSLDFYDDEEEKKKAGK